MRWLVVAVAVALAAIAAASTLLLAYGGNRHDPVGNLSPVGHIVPVSHVVPAPVVHPPSGERDRADD